MNLVIGTAIGSATLTYEIIAVFGYLTFGSKVYLIFKSLILMLNKRCRLARISLRCTPRHLSSSQLDNWVL